MAEQMETASDKMSENVISPQQDNIIIRHSLNEELNQRGEDQYQYQD